MRVLEVKCNTDAESEVAGKWQGYVTASIAVTLDRAWQIGSDFSGLHKFVPIVEVCERLKGCNRSPGCLRFYTMNSATGLPGGKRKAWAKDRLLSLNDESHSFAYAVEGSNMNLEKCEVSFKASDGKDGTTIIKWGWEVDPVKKSTKEKTLGEMSEFGCTFIKGLEAAAATTDSIDMDFEAMARSSTTPMSVMPPLREPKIDTQREFEYESATSHVPRTYDFESADFRLESANAHGFKKFEIKSMPSPLLNANSFADGVINPAGDELVRLEAEVGSLGF